MGEAATGAQAIVAELEAAGVEVVFGLPGTHNLALYEALRTSPIRVVGVRHEAAAAGAADGYARATGRVGVAVVTSGPGAANTLGAVGEAWASASPVLVIATDVPTTLRRPGVVRGSLHESADPLAMFAGVTVERAAVQAGGDLLSETRWALARAATFPSGPVVLSVPTDLLRAPTTWALLQRGAGEPMDDAAVLGALSVLERAERPLIWAGTGVVRSRAGASVARLAVALAAPVLTSYGGRGALPPGHPCDVGLPVHLPEVAALWDEADVVVSIASDLDGINTMNWGLPQPPRLVAVNLDPADAAKNYAVDRVVDWPAADVCDRLAARLGARGDVAALGERLTALRAGAWARLAGEHPRETAWVTAVGGAAEAAGAVLVCDMCVAGYWLGGFWRPPGPGRLLYPMGWGTLGFALPAALGAALAGAGPAVCVVGDGGALFAVGELATLAQEGLDVRVVVVDDGGYGMLRHDQAGQGLTPFGVDLRSPDFAAVARAFGLPAREVTEATVAEALVADAGPCVLHLRQSEPFDPPPTTSPRWFRRGR